MSALWLFSRSSRVLLQVAVVLLLAAAGFGQQIVTFDINGAVYIFPESINVSGVIAGYYFENDRITAHAFVRDATGGITTFDVGHGIGGTAVMGINDSGQVVGTYQDTSALARGFVRDSAGNVTTIDAPSTNYTAVYGINNAGQIVGTTGLAAAFVRNADGSFALFNPASSAIGIASAINSTGRIVGRYRTDNSGLYHGFIRYLNGHFSLFDPSGVGGGWNNGTQPVAINDNGAVAGWFQDATLAIHGFVRDSVGVTTQVDGPSASYTFVHGMNNSGTTTGWYTDATNDHGFTRSKSGVLTTFDAAAYPGSTYAMAINGLGQITGYYIDSTGYHGFFRKAK